VYAPNNAVVLKTGWGPRAGNYIELGNSQGNLTHKLFHLNDILVKKGDTVTRGQEIAKSGNTGDSTGAHLHWEKWVNGNPVDPVSTMKSWSKQ
jgi:murein DD-endopeptidase